MKTASSHTSVPSFTSKRHTIFGRVAFREIEKVSYINAILGLLERKGMLLSLWVKELDARQGLCAKILTGYEEGGRRS